MEPRFANAGICFHGGDASEFVDEGVGRAQQSLALTDGDAFGNGRLLADARGKRSGTQIDGTRV